MAKDELQRRIDIILSQVHDNAVVYDSLTSGVNLIEIENLIAGPGTVAVIYEPLLLLRTLFGQCDPGVKGEFVPFLLSRLKPDNARVIGHAVLDIGTLGNLKPYLSGLSPFVVRMWSMVDEKLAMESF